LFDTTSESFTQHVLVDSLFDRLMLEQLKALCNIRCFIGEGFDISEAGRTLLLTTAPLSDVGNRDLLEEETGISDFVTESMDCDYSVFQRKPVKAFGNDSPRLFSSEGF